VSRNNDARHQEFLQTDFYSENIFLFPSRNNFPSSTNQKINRPPLAARRGLPSYSRTTTLCATVKNTNAFKEQN
jgi:hypothetical protein